MYFKYIIQKIKYAMGYSFCTGFVVGCFPNPLSIHFEEKKYDSVPIPLLSGTICSMGVIFSPFLVFNYISSGVYFDKLYDRYDIKMERYQYNSFPSQFVVHIKEKNKIKQDRKKYKSEATILPF